MNTKKHSRESPGDQSTTASLEQFGDADLLDAWTRDRLAEAFAVLVARHGRMVLTVCRRKCRSVADADDAFQSTFLVLAKNSAKISRPECLAGWLHRVAHRASIATLSLIHQSPDSMVEHAMIDDPLDRITQQHDAIVLDEELAGLPEHYRAALVMQVYEDCPVERLAEHFQTSLGSIRGRLQRGKKLLADRLRRRGIVPVLAFAAAGSTALTAGDVSAASSTLLVSLGGGVIPSPPIAENLLNPLVIAGKRIMTPLNALGGLAAIGTIAAMMVVPGIGSDGGGANTTVVDAPITIRAEQETIVAQFGAPPAEVPPQQQAGSASASTNNQTVLRRRYHAATPTGPLAESLAEMLDEEVELQIAGDLNSLVDQLESQLEKPVILSQRVIDYAQLEPSTPLQYTSRSEPLRTALRKLLQPLGLKATIESEGLVITADHAALVHRGIGTDQWLSVNDKMMREAEQKLAKMISKLFVETPLSEAVSDLSLELDLAIVIDTRSLEEIGLDADAGVACDVKSLSGYDLISWLLRDLELTLSVNGNLFTVMTLESAEDNLLNRVYWLEGIGLGGDFDSLLSLIETTILPDTWEALGGSSTMSPALGNRPGLVVSTTYNVHRQIEQLINALRENSFELDALSEEVEVTLPVPPPVQSGGAFSGGGQGGGGQGGGFM